MTGSPGIHWLRGWIGLWDCLEALERWKISCPVENRASDLPPRSLVIIRNEMSVWWSWWSVSNGLWRMWKESWCQWRCYPLVCWHGLSTITNRRSLPKFEPSTSNILSWSTRTALACHKVMQLSNSILRNSLVRRCKVTCFLHVDRRWLCTHLWMLETAHYTGLEHASVQILHTSRMLLEFPFHFLFQKFHITRLKRRNGMFGVAESQQ